MSRRKSLFAGILSILFPALIASQPTIGHADGTKPLMRIDDLYRFDAPTSAVLAPGGRRLAYVRQWIDRDSKKQHHSLWLVEGSRKRKRPVEKGEPDGRAPVFSPDGKWIALLSTRARPRGWKQIPPTPAHAHD